MESNFQVDNYTIHNTIGVGSFGKVKGNFLTPSGHPQKHLPDSSNKKT